MDLDIRRLAPDNADMETWSVADRTITGCGRHFTSKASLEDHVRTVHLGTLSKRQRQRQEQGSGRRKRTAQAGIEDGGDGLADSTAQATESKKRKKRDRKAPTNGNSAIDELMGPVSPVGDENPFNTQPGWEIFEANDDDWAVGEQAQISDYGSFGEYASLTGLAVQPGMHADGGYDEAFYAFQ